MRPSSWALVGGMALFGAAAGYYTGESRNWRVSGPDSRPVCFCRLTLKFAQFTLFYQRTQARGTIGKDRACTSGWACWAKLAWPGAW